MLGLLLITFNFGILQLQWLISLTFLLKGLKYMYFYFFSKILGIFKVTFTWGLTINQQIHKF